MSIKKISFIIANLLAAISMQAQTTWYVTVSGNDNNDGKTVQTAFRTLQKAADLVNPGDQVLVGSGIYTNEDTSNGSAVLKIHRSGTEKKWITWKAIKGERPVISPIGWSGIQVTGSYNIIDGINVIGRNDSLVLKDAIADSKNQKPSSIYNSNGICVDGRNNAPNAKPHHTIIRNLTAAKCPGGGITGLETDYLTVEDCLVYDNAWYMRYAGSGITTLNNWAHDNKPGYHIIIQRNKVWNNKTLVPWGKTGKLSDGNGILLDVTNQDGLDLTNPDADPSTQQKEIAEKKDDGKPRRPIWENRALIANNVSSFNGGSGIHVFRTCHVDIINNTTYWNGVTVNYQELFPNYSYDVVIMNNIMFPRPGGKVTSNSRCKDIRWDYNLYPVVQDVFKGEHDIVADPMFVDAYTDLSKANFKLKAGSPALNSGTDEVSQATDNEGTKRPKGKRDRGAFEQ